MDLGVGVKITLKWNLKKYERSVWIGFIWLRVWTSGGLW